MQSKFRMIPLLALLLLLGGCGDSAATTTPTATSATVPSLAATSVVAATQLATVTEEPPTKAPGEATAEQGSEAIATTGGTDATAVPEGGTPLPEGGYKIVIAYADKLATLNPDGSDLQVIAEGVTARNVRWSPDRSRIAYIQEDPNENVLWTIGFDGNDRRRIVGDPYTYVDPLWSPNGKQLALNVVSMQAGGLGGGPSGGGTQIWVVNDVGNPTPTEVDKDQQPLVKLDGQSASWRVGGELLYNDSSFNLAIAKVSDGSSYVFLANSDIVQPTPPAGSDSDGSVRLLNPTSGPSDRVAALASGTTQQIVTADSAGRDLRVVGEELRTSEGDYSESLGCIAWSPTEPNLAYEVFASTGVGYIMVVDGVKGKLGQPVVSINNGQVDENYSSPSWNNDGTEIAVIYTSAVDNTTGVAVSGLAPDSARGIFGGNVTALDWVSGCRSRG